MPSFFPNDNKLKGDLAIQLHGYYRDIHKNFVTFRALLEETCEIYREKVLKARSEKIPIKDIKIENVLKEQLEKASLKS